MPKDIQKGIKRLSIQERTSLIMKPKKQPPKLLNERWVYGFYLKNKLFRRLSEIYGLPWQSNPIYAMNRLQSYIVVTLVDSNVFVRWKTFDHRGRPASFIVLLEDDGRKRLENNRFTEEQMDKVRSVLLLPEGTKPKWYCKSHDYHDDGAGLSSEDEDFPPVNYPKLPVGEPREPRNPTEESSAEGGEESDTDDDESDYDELGVFYRAIEGQCRGENKEDAVEGTKVAV